MIIFDLDGTLADCSHRQHFVENKYHYERVSCDVIQRVYENPNFKPNWDAFHDACDQDKPIPKTIQIFEHFQRDTYGYPIPEVQIWSGRSESVVEKTQKWVDDNISYHCDVNLKMRPIGDTTPEDELKEKWLDEAIAQGKTIDFVFDDSETCCKMWRRRGIFVFNCAQHNEEF